MSSEPTAAGDAPTRLVLVRHGESTWNAAGRFQGHGGYGLSELGRAQAAAVARLLRERYSDAAVIARSDLQRVAETALPSEEASGLPVLVDERLREIDVGSWTGLTHAEVRDADPGGVAAWGRGEDVRRGGGETFAELRRRTWDALTDVAAKTEGGTALVFTHGGPIRVAVAAALDLPPLGERVLAGVGNCSITLLERVGAATRLVAYNETAHLEQLGRTTPG